MHLEFGSLLYVCHQMLMLNAFRGFRGRHRLKSGRAALYRRGDCQSLDDYLGFLGSLDVRDRSTVAKKRVSSGGNFVMNNQNAIVVLIRRGQKLQGSQTRPGLASVLLSERTCHLRHPPASARCDVPSNMVWRCLGRPHPRIVMPGVLHLL